MACFSESPLIGGRQTESSSFVHVDNDVHGALDKRATISRSPLIPQHGIEIRQVIAARLCVCFQTVEYTMTAGRGTRQRRIRHPHRKRNVSDKNVTENIRFILVPAIGLAVVL